jgi:rhodanese-related sulfurtransferase
MTSKTTITIITIFVVIIGGYLLLQSRSEENNSGADSTFSVSEEPQLVSLTSSELATKLGAKDFTLIDVHTPEQQHIPETDYFISYKDIDKIEAVLESKDQKVVLYCRSGSMSKIAGAELLKRGYTNVLDLDKGMNEWLGGERPTTPVGSILQN